jgi:hypothetical protein
VFTIIASYLNGTRPVLATSSNSSIKSTKRAGKERYEAHEQDQVSNGQHSVAPGCKFRDYRRWGRRALNEPEPGWLASTEDTDEVDAHHACGRRLRRPQAW